MTDVLHVALREQVGTRSSVRLRRAGQIPAILYGHGLENVSLAVPATEIETAIRHGSKLVDLQGVVAEKAIIRSVQWDAFGSRVLHLDLTRVSEQERVTVSVRLDIKGEALGAKEGGMTECHIFELEVECPAFAIPERLVANVKDLELGHSLTAGEVPLPEQIRLVTPADTVVVSCQAQGPGEEGEEEAVPATAVEPEVIGRKPDESEEESD